MTSKEELDYSYKILTLGEQSVGKTSILLRFTDNKFYSNHIYTIGIDYKFKIVNINNKTVKLKIWDTAGQERFRNITQQYYKGTDGVFLVYDITDRNTFEKVRDWMKQIKEHTQTENIGIMLLGNKCDLNDKREVSFEEGNGLANEYGIMFKETSAYKDINISECFNDLVTNIMPTQTVSEQKEEPITIIISNKQKEKEVTGCCYRN